MNQKNSEKFLKRIVENHKKNPVTIKELKKLFGTDSKPIVPSKQKK